MGARGPQRESGPPGITPLHGVGPVGRAQFAEESGRVRRGDPVTLRHVPAHAHMSTFRVVMSEVDASQIHFTAVHRWMDRGLSEWLAEIGRPFTRILEEGPGIPIVETRCRFVGRIMLDDMIDQRTEIGGLGSSSFRSRHLFTRAGEPMAHGEFVHVCVNRATREPVAVPEWLREAAATEWPEGIFDR